MNNNPYLNQYKQNAVMTASPERILIMLYEGAINFLVRAKIALEEKNIETWHTNLTKTQKIIREFINSLDMETGGEVALTATSQKDKTHPTATPPIVPNSKTPISDSIKINHSFLQVVKRRFIILKSMIPISAVITIPVRIGTGRYFRRGVPNKITSNIDIPDAIDIIWLLAPKESAIALLDTDPFTGQHPINPLAKFIPL